MFFTKGITLLELLVAIAMVAVLLVVGIPSFRAIIQNNKVSHLATQWVQALHLARSEAIRRGQPVSICSAQADMTGCGDVDDWIHGWLVFLDPNEDGVLDTLSDRMAIQSALPAGTVFDTTVSVITFSATGLVTRGAGSVTLSADGCQGNHGRLVSWTDVGRVSVEATVCSQG